ncbi:MAG: hypothetical protein JSR91_00460 [Proteobacteria bacterium]|nr:hypothetical protein [Pseudomonadota bacterium]
MMVWTRSGDRQALQVQERERQHFERELRSILEVREATLALARMTSEEAFSFDPEMSGGPAAKTLRHHRREIPQFFGVVHENADRPAWAKLEKWIRATMQVDVDRQFQPLRACEEILLV